MWSKLCLPVLFFFHSYHKAVKHILAYICMNVNELSLVPKPSLALFFFLDALLLVSSKFSSSFPLSGRGGMWSDEQTFLWSLLHQRYESGDLWNKKLSMTETSDRVRTQRSAILQTHLLRWAEFFKMIRRVKPIGLIRAEERGWDLGTWLLCVDSQGRGWIHYELCHLNKKPFCIQIDKCNKSGKILFYSTTDTTFAHLTLAMLLFVALCYFFIPMCCYFYCRAAACLRSGCQAGEQPSAVSCQSWQHSFCILIIYSWGDDGAVFSMMHT